MHILGERYMQYAYAIKYLFGCNDFPRSCEVTHVLLVKAFTKCGKYKTLHLYALSYI